MPQDTYHDINSGKLPQFRSLILVAMGSNQDSPLVAVRETIPFALTILSEMGAVIRKVSPLYATPCFPAGAGPDYVNGAALLEVVGSPKQALALLHTVEAQLGRERLQRWGQRTLDLDLLAVGQTVLPDRETALTWINLPLEEQVRTTPDRLILPHPRLQDRAFVLGPLKDIASNWVHPLTGRTVQQMYDALPQEDKNSLKPLVNR